MCLTCHIKLEWRYYTKHDKMHLINKIFNNETIIKVYVKDEGNETVANCKTLKLKAQDGKYRLTDVVDIEGMFGVIEPSLTMQRALDRYRTKRIKVIQERILNQDSVNRF